MKYNENSLSNFEFGEDENETTFFSHKNLMKLEEIKQNSFEENEISKKTTNVKNEKQTK